MTANTLVRLSALALLVAACSGSEAEPSAEPGTTPIAGVTLTPSDIAVASEVELVAGVTMSGPLEPIQTVDVKAQVGGRIARILVDRGTRVTAGQVLAEISAEGVKGQALSAQANVASADAALALATQRLESSRRLHAAGAISDIDLRAAEAGHQAATAQVAAARAQLAAATEAESHTTVKSPIAGIVSERLAEEGEAIKDGDPMLAVVDISSLELEAQVGVNDASRVRVGAPVVFTVGTQNGESMRGRVTRIAPRADAGTRQVGVAATLANPGARIVAGQFAYGRILTGSATTGVAIPIAAVSDSAGQPRVFLIQDGKLAVRPVTLGARDESRGLVAVESGLSANDRVLARPVLGAANGLPVTIASDSGSARSTPSGSN